MKALDHRPWIALLCMGGGLVAAAGTLQPASSDQAGGGSRQTARYTLDDAVGGWSHLAEADAGTWIKPDFCGSLVDPVGLEVVSPAPSLGEGQALQLASVLRCDDDSRLGNGFTTHWQVVTGPLLGSGDGWVTGQPVYRDSNAIAQASSAGLSAQTTLLIRNTHLDNYGLYAGDLVDDAWQVQYFGLDNPLALAGADPDQDGADNLYEFTTDTNPGLDTDTFALAIQRQTNLVQVGLGPLATGRTYRVQRATNLFASAWSGVTNIVADSPEWVHYLADTQSEDQVNFYRVAVDHDWRATP